MTEAKKSWLSFARGAIGWGNHCKATWKPPGDYPEVRCEKGTYHFGLHRAMTRDPVEGIEVAWYYRWEDNGTGSVLMTVGDKVHGALHRKLMEKGL